MGRPASLPLYLFEHAAPSDRPTLGDLRQTGAGGGSEPSKENRGYLLRVHVQDTERSVPSNAPGSSCGCRGSLRASATPYWVSPSGYGSPEQTPPLHQTRQWTAPRLNAASFLEQLASHEIVAGTPDQVIAALRVVLETCRPSILMLWGNDGKVGHPDAMRCIELTGQEVLPALRRDRR